MTEDEIAARTVTPVHVAAVRTALAELLHGVSAMEVRIRKVRSPSGAWSFQVHVDRLEKSPLEALEGIEATLPLPAPGKARLRPARPRAGAVG